MKRSATWSISSSNLNSSPSCCLEFFTSSITDPSSSRPSSAPNSEWVRSGVVGHGIVAVKHQISLISVFNSIVFGVVVMMVAEEGLELVVDGGDAEESVVALEQREDDDAGLEGVGLGLESQALGLGHGGQCCDYLLQVTCCFVLHLSFTYRDRDMESNGDDDDDEHKRTEKMCFLVCFLKQASCYWHEMLQEVLRGLYTAEEEWGLRK